MRDKIVPLFFEFFPKSNYITLTNKKSEIWKYLEL